MEWLDDDEMAAWRAVIGVSVRLVDVVDDALRREHGVSGLDYGVLATLADVPEGMRAGDLAAEVGDSSSCLAHRVRRLESAGLVARGTAAGDGRVRVVRITAAGRRLLRAAAPDHVRVVREHCIDLLSPAEQRHVSRALGKILTHLRSGPHQRARR